jgi:hypothetical protein
MLPDCDGGICQVVELEVAEQRGINTCSSVGPNQGLPDEAVAHSRLEVSPAAPHKRASKRAPAAGVRLSPLGATPSIAAAQCPSAVCHKCCNARAPATGASWATAETVARGIVDQLQQANPAVAVFVLHLQMKLRLDPAPFAFRSLCFFHAAARLIQFEQAGLSGISIGEHWRRFVRWILRWRECPRAGVINNVGDCN